MKIRNVTHKGLKKFIERGDPSGLPPAAIDKIQIALSFLQDMGSADELRRVSMFKAHQLTGNRKGVWSISITRNWRVTFSVDEQEQIIIDLGYEDYH